MRSILQRNLDYLSILLYFALVSSLHGIISIVIHASPHSLCCCAVVCFSFLIVGCHGFPDIQMHISPDIRNAKYPESNT
jgi:hypothetical protein